MQDWRTAEKEHGSGAMGPEGFKAVCTGGIRRPVSVVMISTTSFLIWRSGTWAKNERRDFKQPTTKNVEIDDMAQGL